MEAKSASSNERQSPMISHTIRHMALGVAILLGLGSAAAAQSGPGATPIAPGVANPTTGLPGIGPGNVPVAPGPAAAGVPLEQMSPGGVRQAPGPDLGHELTTPVERGARHR